MRAFGGRIDEDSERELPLRELVLELILVFETAVERAEGAGMAQDVAAGIIPEAIAELPGKDVVHGAAARHDHQSKTVGVLSIQGVCVRHGLGVEVASPGLVAAAQT